MTDFTSMTDSELVSHGFREYDLTFRRYLVNKLFDRGLIESKEATDPQILDALEESPVKSGLIIQCLQSIEFRETFIRELGNARDRVRRKDEALQTLVQINAEQGEEWQL